MRTRLTVATVVLIPLIFLVAVFYDQMRANELVPSFLRYVPPDVTTFLVTDHVGRLTDAGTGHAPLLWLNTSLAGFEERLREHCAGFADESDLDRRGFDSTRGAVLFEKPRYGPIIELPDYEMPLADLAIAMPVADRDLAIDFMRSLFVPPIPLTFGVTASDSPVKEIRIDRGVQIEGARICDGTAPIPMRLSAGTAIPANPVSDFPLLTPNELGEDLFPVADLFVVPEREGPLTFDIKCTAVHEDGTESRCLCILSDVGEPCAGVVGAFPNVEEIKVTERPSAIERFGDEVTSIYLDATDQSVLIVVVATFPDQRTEQEAGPSDGRSCFAQQTDGQPAEIEPEATTEPEAPTDDESIPEPEVAEDDSPSQQDGDGGPSLEEQVAFLNQEEIARAAAILDNAAQTERNIRRFRNDDSYLLMLADFTGRRRPGGAHIVGSTGSLVPTVLGSTQFEASVLADNIQVTLTAPVETRNSTVLEMIAEPAPDLIPIDPSPAAVAHFALWDPSLAEYLRYVDQSFPPLLATIAGPLGNFRSLLYGLVDKNFTRLQLEIFGAKDGVGGLAASVNLSAADADLYISRIGNELQESRDRELLQAAFYAACGEGAIRTASTVADLKLYLTDDETLLQDYTMEVAGDEELFASFDRVSEAEPLERVESSFGGMVEDAVFLSPKVTDSDIALRYDSAGVELDTTGLKDGAYRTIALKREEDLVLASNITTLEQLLSKEGGGSAAPEPPLSGKGWFFTDPQVIRTELALYPDEDARKAMERVAGILGDYRRLQALLYPEDGVLTATVLLDHDD